MQKKKSEELIRQPYKSAKTNRKTRCLEPELGLHLQVIDRCSEISYKTIHVFALAVYPLRSAIWSFERQGSEGSIMQTS